VINRIIILCASLLLSMTVLAELEIQITQGVDNPTSIAVVPFGWQGKGKLPENIANITASDLERSGLFRPIDPDNLLDLPRPGDKVFYRDWSILGAEYILTGNLEVRNNQYFLKYELHDVFAQKKAFSLTVEAGLSELRAIAHFVSDKVYEHITGIKGVFSTKIIYVEAINKDSYKLVVADADGERPSVLVQSKHPMLSPNWSPDGTSVTYVSFETGRPAIFIQNIRTQAREQVTNFRGLNGAPVWSPNGKKLAMVLSKDGNPEIYTLDLKTRMFTRITKHFSIDTEPNWARDGQSIIFTSNRGGKPQIYQVTLASGRVERLTFEGDYNARPRVSPDGKSLIMVHRSERSGTFHIASQDIATGDLRILTETHLDESPTIAPNGAMLLYATRYKGKGILAAVSLDAGVKYRLPSKKGDVREPAWSPFLY
jgi:TolB protein